MHEQIIRQKELLSKFNSNLYELKNFIKGETPSDIKTCEEITPNCLLDDIRINTVSIETAILLIAEINEAIRGGK